MTNAELIKEYINGNRTHNAVNHIGYKGSDLFSYSTKICEIDRDKKSASVNTKYYSNTTSRQTSELIWQLKNKGYSISTYEGEWLSYFWNGGMMGAPIMTAKDMTTYY